MSADIDGLSTAEAEAGAEQARAGLVSTLNQLRENLKPANVVEEVMGNAKVSASALSDQVWDTARRNPVPALMIGAGLAMILGVRGKVASTRTSRNSFSSDATDVSGPEFQAHIAQPGSGRSSSSRAGSTLSSAFSSARSQAGGLLDSANERLTSAASRGASRIGKTFQGSSNAGETMSYTRSRDQVVDTISKTIEQQPLILAAVGLAIGAAIGAAIPQTETENSLMGQSSGSVRDAAQSMVQQQVTQLKSAATHAVDEIKQTVADHGVNADNLSGLVHDVADKAKIATVDATKKFDPTT